MCRDLENADNSCHTHSYAKNDKLNYEERSKSIRRA